MASHEKLINYKVLGLVILYNFDIKFDFIWDHIKKLWIFLRRTICRGRLCHHPPLKCIFRGRGPNHSFLQMLFSGAGDGTICRGWWWDHPPLEMYFHGRAKSYSNSSAFVATGYILTRPKKSRGVAANRFCNSVLYLSVTRSHHLVIWIRSCFNVKI